MQEGENFHFKIQTKPLIFHFRCGTANGCGGKVGREENAVRYVFFACKATDEGGGKNVPCAVEEALDVFMGEGIFYPLTVGEINGDFLFVQNSRNDRHGANFQQIIQDVLHVFLGDRVGDIGKERGFCDVGQNVIRALTKLAHFIHVCSGEACVQFTAVAHNGIDDKFPVFHEEIILDKGNQINLFNRAQISADDIIELEIEGFPVP